MFRFWEHIIDVCIMQELYYCYFTKIQHLSCHGLSICLLLKQADYLVLAYIVKLL